jgi:hypothetical protein
MPLQSLQRVPGATVHGQGRWSTALVLISVGDDVYPESLLSAVILEDWDLHTSLLKQAALEGLHTPPLLLNGARHISVSECRDTTCTLS